MAAARAAATIEYGYVFERYGTHKGVPLQKRIGRYMHYRSY
jgi:hypothetical protein